MAKSSKIAADARRRETVAGYAEQRAALARQAVAKAGGNRADA